MMFPSLSLSSFFCGVGVNGSNWTSQSQNLTPTIRYRSSVSTRQTRTSFSLSIILALCVLINSTATTDSGTIVIAKNSESPASLVESAFSNSSEAEMGTNTSETETGNSFTRIDPETRTHSQFEHTKKGVKDKTDPKDHKRRWTLYSSSSSTSSTSRSPSTYYDFVLGTSCSDNDICGKVIQNKTYKMDGSIDCTPVVVEQRNRQRRQLKQRHSRSKHHKSDTNRILDAIVVVDGPRAVLDCQGHSIRVKGDANIAFTDSKREDPVDVQDLTSSQPSKVSNIPLVQLINGGSIHNCTLIQTSDMPNASTMTAIQIGPQTEEDSKHDDGSISSCFSYEAEHLNIRGPFATGIDVTIQTNERQSRCHQDIHIHNSILQQVRHQGISIAETSQSIAIENDHENEILLPSIHIDLQEVQIFLSDEDQTIANGIILSLGERVRNETLNESYSTSSIEVVLDGILIASSSELESSQGIRNVVSLDSPTSLPSTGDSNEDTDNIFEDSTSYDGDFFSFSDDNDQAPINGGGIVVSRSSALKDDLSRYGTSSTHSYNQLVINNVTVLSMTHGLILDANSNVVDLSVLNSQFSNNQMDGIKLVGEVGSIELDNLLVAGNGKNGIIISTPSLCHGTMNDLSISNIVSSGNFGRGLTMGCLSSHKSVSENGSIYYLERVYTCGNGHGGMALEKMIYGHTEFGPGIVGDECHVINMTDESRRATIQNSCSEYISPCHICSAPL
mmetsp:Transcript_31143/g.75280  ORF Transcript_31143/g.75280 Transcript_31143/m.75280 type:complete len:731 (+) Transcript_31143:95-2287(+)